MSLISIKRDPCGLSCFLDDEYIVDTNRAFGGCKAGDLICFVHPFFGIPLQLQIAIRKDGSLVFRSWSWVLEHNHYLHTSDNLDMFSPTLQQVDTVNGLFSGRIRFEGLKLDVGASVQALCKIDVKKESSLIGRPIYLA